MRSGVDLAHLNIADASERWLEDKKLYLKARTVRDYRQYFHALATFFGPRPIKELHAGNVRAYQKWRMENGPVRHDARVPKNAEAGAGPTRINNEVRALGQLMKDARLWQKIREYHKPLPEPAEGPGRAITKDQARHLFRTAAKNSRWQVALWWGLISANSTGGPGELLNVQLQDVDLENGVITIRRGVKNRFRVRDLVLTGTGLKALRKLAQRALAKGSTEPHHYLFPARRHGRGAVGYDPARPQGSFRRSWNAMTAVAGLPGLRPYDMRHTSITWMAGDPTVSTQTVVEVAGWSNTKMLRRYSHQNREAKRKASLATALDQLDLFAPPKKPAQNLLDGIDVEKLKVQ
jgi:integrase